VTHVPQKPWWTLSSRTGVLVSGGAPNLHLAAGALCAFYENEVSFDVIGTAGAGALPALLYAVPKSGDQVAALKATVDLNVHDAIYNLIPYNFKLFSKRGPFSEPFWRLGRLLPRFTLDAGDRYEDSWKRLYNDWMDFTVAALTPTTLWYGSPSVCTRIGAVDDLVAWDDLPNYPKEFYLNAFDLANQELELFHKGNLDPASFYAALAMPWLYEPTVYAGTTYTEGAAHDPSGLDALWDALWEPPKPGDPPGKLKEPKVDVLIALDTIGPELWVDPANIHEGLELAVMDPIICLSQYVLALYGRLEYVLNQLGRPAPKLYVVPFPIAPEDASQILDWSYSNAVALWDVGYRATEQFCQPLKALLGGNQNALESYRYYPQRRTRPLVRDFLRLFDNVIPS
jgi:NTE family protein